MQNLAVNFGIQVQDVDMIGVPTEQDLTDWERIGTFIRYSMKDTSDTYLHAGKPNVLGVPQQSMLVGVTREQKNKLSQSYALRVFTQLSTDMNELCGLAGVRRQSQPSHN